jgi:hypothetical protein
MNKDSMNNRNFKFVSDKEAKTLVFLEGGVTPNLILSIAVLFLNGWGAPFGVVPGTYGVIFDPATGEPVDGRFVSRPIINKSADLLHAGLGFEGLGQQLLYASLTRSIQKYLAYACEAINVCRSTQEIAEKVEVCVNTVIDTALTGGGMSEAPTAWDLALAVGTREKHSRIPTRSSLTGDARNWFDITPSKGVVKRLPGKKLGKALGKCLK